MSRLYIKGIGMILYSWLIGNGALALPYAFSRAGVFSGTVHLVISLFIVYLLHQSNGKFPLHQKASKIGLFDMWKCI